jgi:amino acid adenylation domain-containing protein
VGEVVRRHEILRTRFLNIEGVGSQVIDPAGGVDIEVTDLSVLDTDERHARTRQLIQACDEHEFDLARERLFRIHVLRLGEAKNILILTMHHIIVDGWSMGILFREISDLYAAYRQGRVSRLPELSVQYADYALWQRQWLQSGVLSKQLAYWKKRLEGAQQSLNLPFDRPRPAVQSFHGEFIAFVLSQPLRAALSDLAHKYRMTLFMVLTAAFQALLSRLSGQKDVLLGTPVEGRTHPETEGLIGYFTNTLILRTDFSGDPTVEYLLMQVKECVLAAYDNRDLPLDQLVAELRPERDLSRQPLFQVDFVFQDQNSDIEAFKIPGLKVSSVRAEQRTAKFDLELSLSDTGTELKGGFEYATDLFERETIERLIGHFKTLAEAVVADPQRPIGDLPLMGEAERRRLLVEWNETAAPYPRDKTLHQLFEEQVTKTPDAVAVVCGQERLTYGELNAKANQLAHYLRALGVGPETLVGLCVDRSPELVIGLLGVLKAGGAYLPLDPEYPQDRLAFMLEDARAAVLLTQARLKNEVPATAAAVFCLDADWRLTARQSDSNPAHITCPLNLAYVIYTSGSTGRPKGVAIHHSAAVAFLTWASHAFGREHTARTLFSTSICFDLSVFELFCPLITGGAVLLVSDALALSEAPLDPAPLLINTVPSAARALLDAGAIPPSAGIINLAGEPLQRDLVDQLYAALPHAQVYNLYGPSEYTTYTTWSEVHASAPITIGRPIANTRLYILDTRLAPVPIGVPGEIYVAGAGLARGYLQRPALTAWRFVPDPFSSEADARMYRTGDLGRYLAGGGVEYLGRVDHQVKIRGFRIEPGEVENALLGCEGVREAVVVAREDAPGDKRLVAYIVAEEQARPAADELCARLRGTLPEHMVPAALVFLDALPLNPNGKIDRTALPPPGDLPWPGAEYVAPRTATEKLLADIWAEVLRVGRVGIYDNFFALGGHSLLATLIVTRIEHARSISLPIREVLRFPTVAALAAYLDDNDEQLSLQKRRISTIPRLHRDKQHL